MASNYRKLGGYIREIDLRNVENRQDNLLGLSVAKCFIPSIANTVGTDFRKYKVVEKGQFAYIPDTSRRGDKIAIALLEDWDSGLVSNVYTVFEVVGEGLLPKYLELWFRRPEFDRYARFKSHGSVREIFDWEQLCDVELPIPSIAEQQRIVDSFNAVERRIGSLQQLNDKLAATLEYLYEALILNRFIEEEPEGWEYRPLASLCSKIGSGATPRGGKSAYAESGISLIRSTNVFDYKFSYGDLAHISDAQANKLDNVIVEERDVLFNITGVSVARCCIVPPSVLPARVNQHVMIVRPFGDLARWMSYLIMCTLCHPFFKQQLLGIGQSGSTREAINKGEMEAFEVIMPDDASVVSFGKQAEEIYQQIIQGIREIELLEVTRTAMLSQLGR